MKNDCRLYRHPLLWCQQVHVVDRLETESLRLLDHAHGTVYRLPEFVTDCLSVVTSQYILSQDLFIQSLSF